jgi:hypothetical protein
MAEQEQGNIKHEANTATVGLNQDQSLNQIKKGQLTFACNAVVENFDANGVSYQNEAGNELCLTFPEDYVLIGTHFIVEKNKHIYFLVSPGTGDSEIGYMDNNDCVYKTLINAPCLNFNVNYPIHKSVHKITNCTTEIYWTDGYNPRRYLDIEPANIPKILKSGSSLCSPGYSDEIDCNQLKLQPDFPIPALDVIDVINSGNLVAGVYQFAIQYCDALGNPYTSYYSITNPVPIADVNISTVNFNYPVGKSIVINVSNLDITGHFQYFNIAVIKTINAISSVELIGTYYIDALTRQIVYTGQGATDIHLTIADVFEKHPYYEIAQDLTTVQDILIWDDLTSIDRISYQSIASNISLNWETWRVPANESYADESNAANLRGYLRDEVYAFEIVFLLKNGKQTDGFHIPGRIKNSNDNRPDIPDTDKDFVGSPEYIVGGIGYNPYWKIYNTASVSGIATNYSTNPSYKGPYQYGEFAYWESLEEYPCNIELWGDLAGQKIRHHKFPDILVSPIFESKIFTSPDSMVMGDDAIFPIGVKIDVQQVATLIYSSSLSASQKDDIVGFKIVRGDRATNKSIIAKGMLRNIGKYEREEQTFYYPNYPYNDLRTDPFLNSTNNAYSQICISYEIVITQFAHNPVTGEDYADIQFTDCNINKQSTRLYVSVDGHNTFEQCSITKPVIVSPAIGTVGFANYEVWHIWNNSFVAKWTAGWTHPFYGYVEQELCVATFNSPCSEAIVHVVPNTNGPQKVGGAAIAGIKFIGMHTSEASCEYASLLPPIDTTLRDRQVFNSPETSFGQPFLGNILKLESVMFGKGVAHFTEVKENAKYKLLTGDAQRKALDSSNELGNQTSPFDASAMFAAYQAYLTIYINGITRKNFAYSFNSVADYNYFKNVPNGLEVKQRNLDIAKYLIPGVQSVDTGFNINNYQRESSVFLKTGTDLPFPDKSPELSPGGISIVSEYSRFTISEINHCNTPAKEKDIRVVAYYASLKNEMLNQWGQLYSYETIDTGFQRIFGSSVYQNNTIFGGDTFIGRFAFKTKLPFFIDNRVGAPDDSDIFYDEIGNIAYPKYWHSARSILEDYMSHGGLLSNIISYKAHNFDCPNDIPYSVPIPPNYNISTTTTTTTATPEVTSDLTYYDGYFYLFAYGVPNFYCESSYNLDLRQAFNNREGDFWPHVTTSIPDDWVQEHFVSIANDNTYYYNVTFSKQNKENTFTHLPPDWKNMCYTYFPFRAIYSNKQEAEASNRVNNWLTYMPVSYFDFPQNYGRLTTLDGIQNKAVLARFENKSLLYNTLLRIDTSNPQAAYMGNDTLFKSSPPIDFAETDLGYAGSQHKFLLKIPQGQVTIDAKRGQIFLVNDNQVTELSAFGSGMNRFFTDHLAFEILRWFPDVDVDNHFKDVGLHGVYDSKFDRVIITKLDYIPLDDNIVYDNITHNFFIEKVVNNVILRNQVFLTDVDYFCNKSWTLSYNMNTRSWISFHSYIPNFYIAENNFFYSGINGCCDDFDVLVGEFVSEPTTTTTSTKYCALNVTLPCTIDVEILDSFATTTTIAPTTTTSTTVYSTTSTTVSPSTTTTTTTEPPVTTTTTTTIEETTTTTTTCVIVVEILNEFTPTTTTTTII